MCGENLKDSKSVEGHFGRDASAFTIRTKEEGGNMAVSPNSIVR